MSQSNKLALNPSNLAVLGALDDFYDVYRTIEEVYDRHRKLFVEQNGSDKTLWPMDLDGMTRKEVRNLCEPLINKYKYLFDPNQGYIFATAYGFRIFSYLNVTPIHQELRLSIKYISFRDFLEQLQFVVTRILHNRITKEKPKYAFERLSSEIDSRIYSLAKEKASVCKVEHSHSSPATTAPLYLFDVLSSTLCHRNNHPVVPARFVADLANGTGQLILPVHYCNYCDKYFIGTKTLAQFEKDFGRIIVERRKMSYDDDGFSSFQTESKLHQLGYNVIDGNMSEEERHRLLVYLLENKRITYFEICSTIEQNIRLFQFSYRHQLAVTKWKSDLKYIGDYVINPCPNDVIL